MDITVVTLTVSDGKGGVDVADVMVTVEDDNPPAIACTTDVMAFWPPNHEMRDVEICVTATDECDSWADLVVTCALTSSEPDDSSGDGEFTGDVDGEDGYTFPVFVNLAYDPNSECYLGTVQLRAERDGGKTGRVYSIVCEATDVSGNSNTASCTVVVPQDRSQKK